MLKDELTIHGTCHIAREAVIKGTVSLANGASVWYNATVRGDAEPITIGENSNIQDNAVLHADLGYVLTIGKNVTVGHGAIVHGCKIGDDTLIGMGAIILNGATIGSNCIIGAGALVTQNMMIPDNSMVYGNPAKVKRELTEQERQSVLKNGSHYVELAGEELPAVSGNGVVQRA